MGETTGFLKHGRETADAAAGAGAAARLEGGLRAVPRRRRCSTQAGALHGLRHPVLQQRLPARQPHPRLERPRLPRPLARRDRPAARHQQLPRVHRPALPGAVRGGVRARHQRRPGHDQAGRGRDHRPRLGRGLGRAACRRGRAPASGSRSSARARPASPPRSSSPAPATTSSCFERADRIGGLLRYGIPEFKMEKRHLDRRLAQMEAEGTEFRTERRTSASTSTVDELRAEFDADRARRRRHRVARPARSPAASSSGIHQAMEYLPLAQPGAGGRPRRAADHRRRQARRHHRRRRHRRRLPRHRPPPGRGVGAPVRDPAPPARRAGRRQPVAARGR